MSKRFLLVLELPDSFTGDAVDAAELIVFEGDVTQATTYNCMEDALSDYILQEGAWNSDSSRNPPIPDWLGHR